jgi:transcriptional regulator with XRE-family HTH domain
MGSERMEQQRAIGQRIREWRLKRKLSQVAVAQVASITQASLSNYELGKRGIPLSTFLGVALALEVSVSELLDIPEFVVVRDSRLARAVERLVAEPELVDTLTQAGGDADAAG